MDATDLRNLIPEQRGENVKCCSVCGLPEARLNKDVKALPHHAAAIEGDLAGKYRNLSRALGPGKIVDAASGEFFNAQFVSIKAKLIAAYQEHQAYILAKPEPATEKAMLVRTLTQTLAMLGVENLPPNPRPDSKGEYSPRELADAVQCELGKLMEIKRDLESAPLFPEVRDAS